ncbi:MAG: ribonuclease J [Deltaproteobacteria bacterium]|jgi:ribonuclease J|nr:ribonuclease J [Deltaproteobacteria bacterium]
MTETFENLGELGSLDIIPLGGVEEIGLNCTALIYGQDILVIDAGLMFPELKFPGVDLVIPDFSFLKQNAGRVVGLILTHGHEDHVGALAHFLKDVPTTVYATKLTLAMSLDRLDEYEVKIPPTVEIYPREVIKLGDHFEVEFIGVNHSVLSGVALAIKTPLGVVIHTGDFKIDPSAPPLERTDLYTFARYGENGVLALLSDSTNADVPGHSASELEVRSTLTDLFQKAQGRVILACFASSLARIRQVAAAAAESNRKLLFDGRSMINSVGLGLSLGFLDLKAQDMVDLDQAKNLGDHELVVVATGSQGEPLSALARMANGEHKYIQAHEGDTIIFSARVIPGNERAILSLTNLFHGVGAAVIDSRSHQVHASGHGQIEELKLMMGLTNPKYLIPIHGEPQHILKHAALATEMGFSEKRVKILKNGQRLSFYANHECQLGDPVHTGRMVVDGNRLGQADDPVIRSRLSLAEMGLVYVTLILNQSDLTLAAPPAINTHALHYEDEPDLRSSAMDLVFYLLEEWREGQTNLEDPDLTGLVAGVKRNVRHLFKEAIKRKPLVYTNVIFVNPDFREQRPNGPKPKLI